MTKQEEDLRLRASIAGLADREPLVSAKRILTRRQRKWAIAVALFRGRVCHRSGRRCQVVSFITVFYVAAIVYRLVLFRASNGRTPPRS